MLLSPALPPNKTVKEIEWSFSAGAGATIQVAEFGPGGFERPDPKDRFKDRLEMLNETALKIEALERGDSGVYGARIKLHPALVEDQFFNLSVYGEWPHAGVWQRCWGQKKKALSASTNPFTGGETEARSSDGVDQG